MSAFNKEPVWTSNSKAILDMLRGLWGGAAFVWFAVQVINRRCSGLGVMKFRGKFQSSITEIIKKQGAAMGGSSLSPLTLVLTSNSARVVCSAPVLKS